LKAEIMKVINSIIAVLAIASSTLFAAAAIADQANLSCRAHPGGEWPINPAEYVVRNCAFCHGDATVQGRAVAPRLAGQHREYIVDQLERFGNGCRDNPNSVRFMSHVARHTLADSWCEVGAYISTLEPKTFADGNADLYAQGEDIFMHGIPSENIPACQFCHGPEAQGIGRFPRLGGLSYLYMKRRLIEWQEGYSATAPNMPSIAALLTPGEIEAVASYLSFVPAAPSRGEF
jgi:cytochrome c553